MKRIYSNSDLCISTQEIPNIGEHFIINFYTTSKEYTIQKSDQDLIVEQDGKQVLKLNWAELATIGRGVLQYILTNTKTDADYDDGKYDNTFSRTTDYFIVTDLIIDDGDDEKNIREVLADLENQINAEITRSTAKDNDHDSAISSLNTDVSMLWNSVNSTQTELTNLKSDVEDSERVVAEAINDLEDTKAEQDDLQQLRDEFDYERDQRKVDDDAMDDRIENIERNYQPLLTAGTGINITNNVISATGGGVQQVQSDWNQSDTSAVDYIKNKPTNVSAFSNDAGYLTSTDLNGKQDKLTDGYVAKIVDEQAGSSGTLHKLQLVTELNQTIDSIATSQDPYSHWGQGDDHTLATIGLVKAHIPTVPTNVSAFTNDASYITMGALTGYATQQWVLNKGYLTSQALGNYYTKPEIDAMIGSIETSLSQI